MVCPKARLGDLLYVKKGTDKPMGWINKINRNHIDFVLCDPQTMQVVAAVELDDSSHWRRLKNATPTKTRPVAMRGAVDPCPARRSYDVGEIKAALRGWNSEGCPPAW